MTKTEKTQKVENKKTTRKNEKIKIELSCDLYYLDNLFRKGEVLELEESELKKFAESFYKII